jgi:uncharacterized repeat protein (TIGR04052 family)
MTKISGLFIAATLALTGAPARPLAQATPDAGRQIALRFEATVGDEAFACGTRYAGIGTTGSSITVSDFRFYVSGVRLVKDDGTEVPLALTQDGLWQHDDVALLDFEDGTKSCANGTPETRNVIEGRVPDGRYVGVRFAVGLPFDTNHREPTLQPSPLNLTSLFWNWNAGYKFMRIDLKSTGQPQGWMIHLGSTGCTPREGPSTVPVSCRSDNIVSVVLPGMDVDRDVVRLDLRELLADANVDVNQDETPIGCMSGGGDDDCVPLFRKLGLAFRDAPAGTQSVFAARRGPAPSAVGDRR